MKTISPNRLIHAVFVLAAAVPLASQESPLTLTVEESTVDVGLPPPSTANEFQQLEMTWDFVQWFPVARSAAGSWEPIFPHPRPVSDGPGGKRLTDNRYTGPTFYRLATRTGPSLTDAEAASRFLQQSTFGPTSAAVSDLVADNLDFEGWINAEIAKPPTYLWDVLAAYPTIETTAGWRQIHHNVWWHAAIEADDQLRQRMAWALIQIFVISSTGLNTPQDFEIFLTYYDLLLKNALGSFRELLEDVTYSPVMGEYLTYDGNRKAQGAQKPDENYAREVMQLFTIGLWELNQDGTLRLDENGQPIPTYSNSDIETFARVFTGLARNGTSRTLPMRVVAANHDTDEKILLDGVTTLPAGQTTAQDIDGALDFLFAHPNTPPFIARLLIQRLTCSNPSPAYIRRVAEVFADNGAGVRGDLGAVARAILLDPEAREPVFAADDAHGKLREPVVLLMHLCRTFDLTPANGASVYRISNWHDPLPHFPFASPSVFNFYLPDHQPPGEIISRGLFAPEFQIMNDTSTIKFLNSLMTLITDGTAEPLDTRTPATSTGVLDYTEELLLASDANQLVDHLDLLLTAGRLTDANRQTIVTAIEAIPTSDPTNRVKRALRLFVTLPEFRVIF